MKKLADALREVCEEWSKNYNTGCSPSISDIQNAFTYFANVIDPPMAKPRKVKRKQKKSSVKLKQVVRKGKSI